MYVRALIQAILLLNVTVAFAGPVVDLDLAKPDFTMASYMGEDDRKVLSKNIAAIEFSPAEQEQAMRCMGHISCSGGNDGLGSQESAGAVCPIGKNTLAEPCRADRIASAAHMFIDKATNRFIPKLGTCEFINYRGHVSKLEIKDLRVIEPEDDLKNPFKAMRADKIVVRLKKPIPGCTPYEVLETPEVPEANSPVIAVTHLHVDHAGVLDGSEPLAYPCKVMRSFKAKAGKAGVFYNDCDVNPGGSGGFAFVRDENKKLKLAGIFIRIGAMALNGQSYNENEEIKNYTIAVGTNADFVTMLSKPGPSK